MKSIIIAVADTVTTPAIIDSTLTVVKDAVNSFPWVDMSTGAVIAWAVGAVVAVAGVIAWAVRGKKGN